MRSALFATAIFYVPVFISYLLITRYSPIYPGEGAPTPLFYVEATLTVALFGTLIFFRKPFTSALSSHTIYKFLTRPLRVPRKIRLFFLIPFCIGFLGFWFWGAQDAWGGYNGIKLTGHPWMNLIYDYTPMHLTSLSTDQQSMAYFVGSVVALLVFRSNKGIYGSVKDVFSLYIAPTLIAFELSIWYYLEREMAWHVVSELWIGGTNDGGYLSRSSGQYIFSNWYVLFLCIILVASRLPELSKVSEVVWRNVRYDRFPVFLGVVIIIGIFFIGYGPLSQAWAYSYHTSISSASSQTSSQSQQQTHTGICNNESNCRPSYYCGSFPCVGTNGTAFDK